MRSYRSQTASCAILLIAALPALAQSSDLFDKAPPGVEEALRKRVDEFDQLWAKGKFREAEKFVAADSQDAYYQMEKRTYDTCKFLRTRFEDEFTRAIVTTECKGQWSFQGNVTTTGMAITRVWKLQNGDWFWTVDRPKTVDTPFGRSGVSDTPFGGIANSGDSFKDGLPKDIQKLGAQILGQVTIDKSAVRLSSFEKATATVTVHNGLTGPVTVRADADGAPKGFVCQFDRTQIPAQSDAILTLSFDPKDKSPKGSAKVRVSIDPTNQMFSIDVTFGIPAEMERIIEKSRTGK